MTNFALICQSKNGKSFIPVNGILTDVLCDGQTKVYILAGHPSHLPFVSNCLAKCSIPFSVMESTQNITISSSLVTVVGIEDNHSGIIKKIVEMHPNGSLFYVVHSFLSILKRTKLTLFSGDSPIGYTSGFPCVMLDKAKDSRMKLFLPLFSESVSLKQSNEAEMDPW